MFIGWNSWCGGAGEAWCVCVCHLVAHWKILDLILDVTVDCKHQIASVSGYTHTPFAPTNLVTDLILYRLMCSPSWPSSHFLCQGSKDKLGPNRGRFQPKDKAGLVNFEEEQFLEVPWLLRLEALEGRVWPGKRFLMKKAAINFRASDDWQRQLVLSVSFPPTPNK